MRPWNELNIQIQKNFFYWISYIQYNFTPFDGTGLDIGLIVQDGL